MRPQEVDSGRPWEVTSGGPSDVRLRRPWNGIQRILLPNIHLKLMDDAQKMFQSQEICNSLVSDQHRSNRIHKALFWYQDYVLNR